ncbi:polymorphic toxin-type HINT domain-containing protein [Streptomyces sp. NPDC051018]|uniref:polymorphic toxin-type HINT domain-containing protein n=1 Tax=Streptomyces sp. NPDC051018 TaxID=3365639 RepID=UPI0037B2FDE1
MVRGSTSTRDGGRFRRLGLFRHLGGLLRSGRARPWVIILLAVVLAVPAGLTPVAQPAQAADGTAGRPDVPKPRSSKVTAMNAAGAKKARERALRDQATDTAEAARATAQSRGARWPRSGTATVPLTTTGGSAIAGGLPVTVESRRKSSGRAEITVADRRATDSLGLDGVLLSARADRPGAAELSVDYSSFASVIGGDWSARLRLWRLPACALTTPKLAGCRKLTPLDSRNDIRDRSLTTEVDLTAPAVLAVAAGTPGQSPSGSGDYTATPLSSSSKWEAGDPSGSFTWSYPLSAPKLPGPEPSLDLSYDSGSVDGRTASTNNQGTEVGEGFDLEAVSYVERRYGTCDKDGHDKKNDQCWKYENASLVLNGKATELVKDDTTGKWRLKNDDASTVIHQTGGVNADDNGERWIIITGDGTKYHFGMDKLPGATTQRTNSVWTVPVFGDDAGEPGYTKGGTFGERWLNQAWRWNLDYVEDPNGNAMTYWYTAETNHYRRNEASTANAEYNPGGYLSKILYGQRASTLFTDEAPGRVAFVHADRCTASGCAPLNKDNAKHWPDVPFDAICTSGENDTDCIAESPGFFSRKRLTKIETSVLAGTAYSAVDSWTLSNRFIANGDLADPSDQTLTLESVRRTGHTGADITLDPVSFTYHKRPNRVAGGTQPGGGNILPLTRPRLNTVTTETGAITTVTYSDPECVRGSRMPAAEDSNSETCYPQYWHINGATDASVDWFHKYRVTAVNTADPTGHGEPLEYAYTYEKPGWHYNDSPFVPNDERTWSIWRGYQKVTVHQGASTGTRSRTVTSYLQGMHGDRLKSGGTRSVNVPGIDVSGLDVPDAIDADQYAGFERQEITYDGNTPVSVTVNDPWSRRTANQQKSYADIEAYYVRTGKTYAHTYLPVKKTWRTTRTATEYDSYGMVEKVDSAGDTAASGDETCTRTWYARNDGNGINNLVSRTRTVGSACATAETQLNLPASTATRGDVLADTATVYDKVGATGWTADQVPTNGEATWTGRASAYPAAATGGERHPTGWQTLTRATYDALGRARTATDAAGRTTSTVYTPADAGVPTRTTVTNAKTHTTTTVLDGLRGLPVRTQDPNAKTTEQTYDGLGRLTGVWLPNRSRSAGQTPSTSFAYTVKRGVVPSVATSVLKSSTTVQTSYTIYDSLLRQLQTQLPTPVGGRLLTDTRYDSRGQAYETYADIFDSAKAPNGTYTRAEYGGAPKQVNTVFDGAGRTVGSEFRVFGAKKWETSTTHTGDSTATSAVDGGAATRVVSDALGRTVERREYAGTSPADKDYGGGLGATYSSVTYDYTRDGKKTRVTAPDGTKWSYIYDLFGRQVSMTDPDKGTTTSGFTALDQTDWDQNASGARVLYGYDEIGRKTGMWSGTARTDATKLAAWSYDTLAKGQLDSSTRYDGGVAGKAYTREVLAYDSLYRATRTQLSLAATDPLVTSGAAEPNYTFASAFNLDDTLQYTSEPAAGGLPAETVRYGYTSMGQPTSVSGASGYLLDASYSVLGQPQQYTMGVSDAAEAKRTYLDNYFEPGTDRLTRSFVTTPQTAPYKPQDLTYTYDDAGNVTRIADKPNASATLKPDVQCFAYDGHRRLTQAWTPSADDCGSTALGGAAPYRTEYTYNASGQRLTETETEANGAASKTTYCYRKEGQPHALTATTDAASCDAAPAEYDYDKTGNTVRRPGSGATAQTLAWNAEGELSTLTEGSKKTGYLYDADGNLLIRRAAAGDGESVLYLGTTEVHHKVTGTAKKTWATRSYAAGSAAIAVRTNESGTEKVSFLAGDHHGTGSLALDGTTQAVTKRFTTPFGAPRGSAVGGAWPDDKRFLGKPVDTSTGLTQIGARQYDPEIGQFISLDPLIELDKHQTLNGYSYGAQNPVTFADPTGLGLGCGSGPDQDACPGGGSGQPAKIRAPGKGKGGGGKGKGGSGGGNHRYGGPTQIVYKGKVIPVIPVHPAVVVPATWDRALEFADRLQEMEKKNCGDYGPTCYADMITNPEDSDQFQAGISSVAMLKFHVCGQMGGCPKMVSSFAAALGAGFHTAVTQTGSLGLRGAGSPNLFKRGPRNNCQCFLAGTDVLMADGTTKDIEDIEIGDRVRAKDPETGESGAREVTHLIVTDDDKHFNELTITTADGPEKLTATHEHPFWSPSEKRWIEARDLTRGTTLLTDAGSKVTVTHNRAYTLHTRTYNLTVDDLHTYYVLAGETPVLVHNCSAPTVRISPAGSDWATKGAHMHVGSSEVRIFPNGAGGVGFKGLRMSNGMASKRDVAAAQKAIMGDPRLRADLIGKARSAMADMNAHNWGNSVNRAAEMNFLIKALRRIE